MARRKPYTYVEKQNQVRAQHVKGMGDVAFVGFNCLNPDCTEFILVRKSELEGEVFCVECPSCGYTHETGKTSKFYDFELKDIEKGEITKTGEFLVLHDDYVGEAGEYKYCIICNTIKTVDAFDTHTPRKTGRQGECRLCKKAYNSIKNPSRKTEQHMEAAQKRRLVVDLSGIEKLDYDAIRGRFDEKCFKCGPSSKKLEKGQEHIDHTLPVYYLWPYSTGNATLLCKKHNLEKTGKWPSEYYLDGELKQLAVITGHDYKLLAGPPKYNPDALEKLKCDKVVDSILEKYAAYLEKVIIPLRNRVLADTGLDMFKSSKKISQEWIQKADAALGGRDVK